METQELFLPCQTMTWTCTPPISKRHWTSAGRGAESSGWPRGLAHRQSATVR